MATIKKRVECLYRVSTLGQLEVGQNDIPMQKTACREFITKHDDWELVNEYSELGVSGFHIAASDRDAIQQLKADAEKNLFDVLIVFMFDRLGRKSDETPFVLEWFTKHGVEVWSVMEGQQKFETHVDSLINYIRFWQSGGESIKTSIRVNEKHTQMVKEGIFSGGKIPYGYKTIKSGVDNKKGKELLKLVIDDCESEIVKKMFNLVHDENYGTNRIASWLNENNIKSKSGSTWRATTINYILKNPLYKGYFTYDKRSSDKKTNPESKWIYSNNQIKELVIIQENEWDEVQIIRKDHRNFLKTGDNIDVERPNFTTKSPLLFVGMIKCGYCGSPLTTTYDLKHWTTKDGIIHKKYRVKYRCSGKSQNRVKCEGQTTYAQNKIEGIILKRVRLSYNYAKTINLNERINKIINKNDNNSKKELSLLKKKLLQFQNELQILNNEISKSLLGESKFTPDVLSNAINNKTIQVNEISKKTQTLETEIDSESNKQNEIKALYEYLLKCGEEFELVSIDKKKMMLLTIIDSIIVFKDKVHVNFKDNVLELLGVEI